MPATNQRSHARWDSWPPTQMQLWPNQEHDDAEIEEFDLGMDEDPTNYFLTPASPSYEDDLDLMDFDAGIEDSKHPAPIVRSVSPSSLEGLRLLPPRPPTPPKSPSTPDLDVDMAPTPDDDEEDYIHFSGGRSQNLGLPFNLMDYAKSKKNPGGLAPPISHHTAPTASRGGAMTRPGLRSLGSTGSLRGRPQSRPSRSSVHSWREPSPDVWSIEEETEEDIQSKMADIAVEECRRGRMLRAKTIDVTAAKPKKRVRFVLPAREASG